MRKEELSAKKKKTVENELMYTGITIPDDELKSFSIKQLEKICTFLKNTVNQVNSRNPFYALSTSQVLCKENGKIVDFNYGNEVKEVDREYIMNGASRSAMEEYEKEKK